MQPVNEKFIITKATDPSMWYKDYINWTFVVVRKSDKYVWAREPDEFNMMNIVMIEDVEFIKED